MPAGRPPGRPRRAPPGRTVLPGGIGRHQVIEVYARRHAFPGRSAHAVDLHIRGAQAGMPETVFHRHHAGHDHFHALPRPPCLTPGRDQTHHVAVPDVRLLRVGGMQNHQIDALDAQKPGGHNAVGIDQTGFEGNQLQGIFRRGPDLAQLPVSRTAGAAAGPRYSLPVRELTAVPASSL